MLDDEREIGVRRIEHHARIQIQKRNEMAAALLRDVQNFIDRLRHGRVFRPDDRQQHAAVDADFLVHIQQKLRPDERLVATTVRQIFVLQAMPMNVDQHVVSSFFYV